MQAPDESLPFVEEIIQVTTFGKADRRQTTRTADIIVD